MSSDATEHAVIVHYGSANLVASIERALREARIDPAQATASNSHPSTTSTPTASPARSSWRTSRASRAPRPLASRYGCAVPTSP
jgi:hypothetical protein